MPQPTNTMDRVMLHYAEKLAGEPPLFDSTDPIKSAFKWLKWSERTRMINSIRTMLTDTNDAEKAKAPKDRISVVDLIDMEVEKNAADET